MSNDEHRRTESQTDEEREDEPIPRASEDTVLEETARLAREGRKELEADPHEQRPASE